MPVCGVHPPAHKRIEGTCDMATPTVIRQQYFAGDASSWDVNEERR